MIAVAGALLAALALSACGSAQHSTPPPKQAVPAHRQAKPRRVAIYSSLPLDGPQRRAGEALRAGIWMALELADFRAGEFRVSYHSLNDASVKAHGVDLPKTARNAAKVATNPDTMFYIGDLTSAATEVSLPILNPARIPQITPASPYIGLTQSVPNVTKSDEPKIYQPGIDMTLFRMMPNDQVQAQAAVATLRQRGCAHVSAVAFAGSTGVGLVTMMASAAKLDKLELVPYTHVSDKPHSIVTYIGSLHAVAPECFVIAARASQAALKLTEAIRRAYPKVPVILGTANLCNRRWAAPAGQATPADLDGGLYCISPLLKLTAYPGGARFAALWRRHHRGATPSPWALYGYESARLALGTIRRAGAGGDDRQQLLITLSDETHRSFLGSYAFSSTGDTSLAYYGLYHVIRGVPVYYRELDLTRTP